MLYDERANEYFEKGPHRMKVYNFVVENYIIHPEIYWSKETGPKSGLCKKEKLLVLYEMGMLPHKQGIPITDPKVQICWRCGEEGHLAAPGCINAFRDYHSASS